MHSKSFHIPAPGQKSVSLADIPRLSYVDFVNDARCAMEDSMVLPLAYFVSSDVLYMVLFDYSEGIFMLSSAVCESDSMPSSGLNSLYQFERDIMERTGLTFIGHPYPKPLRKGNFKFDSNDNRALHDVNVGPVHAGIIEPGRFRFTCNGEKVVSMEICLGFQHRGIEKMIVDSDSNIKRMALAEQIAGDSVLANSAAMARILENGASYPLLELERTLAVEMERLAMHFSDIAALSGDCAFQLGQTAVEPFRTVVVNSLQMWSGSRSGRSLIRPCGSYYKLSIETIDKISSNLSSLVKPLSDVTSTLLSSPSLLARMDGKCVLRSSEARKFALRGPIAKASSRPLDVRSSGYVSLDGFKPLKLQGGDLLSRLNIRLAEARQSLDLSLSLLKKIKARWFEKESLPKYQCMLNPDSIVLSPSEGFRGTILHIAVTDSQGSISDYRIFDPSQLAWPVLAYVMRGQQISDFPVCNKSFNLSYLANDL